jgi:quercetin dioxygenase-like cupin family protein
MHMTMRKYRQLKGTPETAILWVKKNLMPILKKSKGFKAYYAVAFDDGSIGSINVFESEDAATTQISRYARRSGTARRTCYSMSKQRSGESSTRIIHVGRRIPKGAADAGIPADDPHRKLTVADPDNPALRHISIAGGTYTILVTGAETAGRYCLIDMLVHSGDGPPPHRHDFEEMFTLLEGQLEFTFRGEKSTIRAGLTVNIPANAPHSFVNTSVSACSVCAHQPARSSSSWQSATPLSAARHPRRTSARKKRLLAARRRRRLHTRTRPRRTASRL